MKKYKFTYNTQNTINKTLEIEAENRYQALTQFYMQHVEATEVTKIEEVE